MDTSLLLTSLTTAISIGISCGTTCSPIVTTFLTAYSLSHTDGIKNTVFTFGKFFIGKILSVIILCIISSLIGMQLIDNNGYIGNINLRFIIQIIMSTIGIYLLIKWFNENNKNKCKSCTSCNKKNNDTNSNNIPLFLAGIAYGITPCAPLLLIIGYTCTIPILYAGITSLVFGLSTLIGPIIFLAFLTGTLSKKIRKEIPDFLKWFRLISYILLILIPILVNVK